MADDRQQITQVLTSFFTEECEWERVCDQNLVNDSEQEIIIMNIFKKYCTPKKRIYGDPAIRSYGYNGIYNYNPQTMDIESIEINGNKAIVTIISTEPLRELYQFVLKKTVNGWLIDSKKMYSTWEQKWKNTIL